MKRFILYVGTAHLLTVGTVWAGPFEDATDAYQRGDYATAFKIIQPLAAQGDAGAQYLVMPQLHYEVDRHWMIQVGAGARFTTGFTLPEAGFRIIREF